MQVHLSQDFHSPPVFVGRLAGRGEAEAKLEGVGGQLDGFQRSLEYVQDFINMNGLRIWEEEFAKATSLQAH